MRATRRTIRTAAIATGAIAALALPAGAAFADSPTAPSDPQTQPQVLPGTEDPKQDQKDPKDQVLPDKDGNKKDDSKKDESKKDESKKDDSGKGEKKDESKKDDTEKKDGARSFVKSVKLADGSVAKVYKLGQNHYEAEIWANGSKLDTLVAKGASATGQNNGLYVVLNPDGTVTSWVDGGKKDDKRDGKKDERKDERKDRAKKDERKKDDKKSDVISSVKITMPDGRIAKLIKTTNGPRVEISMPNGNFLGAIDLKDPSALNDGWTYKIVNADKGVYKFVVIDGKNGGDSWVYDFNGKLIEKYTVQKDGKKKQDKTVKTATGVIPKGGVKAGAEGVTGASSDQAPMIAAGGGLAAAGAAGLGFAMLRRRGDQR
ncbi:DNA-directed RNA polymerase I subunit RPA34 [Streptomyces sp. WM6378]|uniref:DNA-directed RNA polymerase I subunit RPA34 n=1 Tax=Streptomyces sp. WM6378 TaxID=1415557 RepID=UPI0006AE7DD0|nr:DNA-directed RNA polymerase I subunit RPA34 [Streptomyces sp. WM6378]